jgi:hypothetical protein
MSRLSMLVYITIASATGAPLPFTTLPVRAAWADMVPRSTIPKINESKIYFFILFLPLFIYLVTNALESYFFCDLSGRKNFLFFLPTSFHGNYLLVIKKILLGIVC